ncbi:MAG: hypothetical protein ACI9HY_000731 [Planctomycetaceae bacterium]|jgi:hypothetical protein
MTRLLFVAILAITTLAGPTVVFAGGLMDFDYCAGIHPSCCQHAVIGSIVTVDITVRDLVNPTFGFEGSRPVTSIRRFEVALVMDPGLYITDLTYPVQAVNLGDLENLDVFYVTPLPVGDYFTVLATVTFILTGFPEENLFANPPLYPCHYEFDPAVAAVAAVAAYPVAEPSLAGRIVLTDADDPSVPIFALDSTEEEWLIPRFRFRAMQEAPVATEDESWGTIKALYR